MQVPEYISIEEVQRICQELGIRDWTTLPEPKVLPKEASIIRSQVGAEAEEISVEDFRKGLEVELEHGIQYPEANVTNNHPILTGKIVLAHLKETLDYYARLEVAELEGDLLKAVRVADAEKAQKVYQALIAAREALAEKESQALSPQKAAEIKVHERRFPGEPEALRSQVRRELLQVDRVVDLCLEGFQPQRVLDIGTGSGLFARAFSDRGLETVGVDANPEMVESARRFVAEADIKIAPAEDLPFPDSSFDLVFMGLVLHETDSPMQAMKEARRVAKSRIVIQEWPYREEEQGPPLAHRLRPDEIESMARQAGFEEADRIVLANTVVYRLNI